MAKFKKALALVLSLAMVLTLAPVANVNAAAKYKISAKTTALAAGKTYNVKVTGVTKNQYVKVARTAGLTVKYSGKTIKASKKVAGTGKALTFKVTAPGKEKAYNATIKVTIFNKKTNKKVKTLSTKRKIKALPVEELALKSVEGADAGTLTTLIAYFNKPVGDLQPGDIEIRKVTDNELVTVEKVILSSDKTKATITLVGAAAGAGATLDTNTDYKMIVTSGNQIAEKVFSIPETVGNATVVSVDPTNKRLDIKNLEVGGRTVTNLNVPDSLNIDYQDVLGKAFTVSYDKTNTITKFADLKEKVVYGAFKLTAADSSITDLATGEKYLVQTESGKMLHSKELPRAAAGKVTDAINTATGNAGGNFGVAADGFIAWAKVTLTASNTIKLIEYTNSWTGFIKVASVANDTAINGKSQVSLKNYVIIKDGKTIKVTDLVAGDVVAYDTTNSFAEVLPAANTIKGTLESVHDGSFTVGGKTYKTSGTDANITFTTKYSKKDALEGTVDNDVLDKLFAAKKEVTVTLNRAGQAVYLEGEQGDAATTTKTLVLTEDSKYYNQSLVDYLRFKGFNGTAVETVDVDINNVTTIVAANGTKYEVGKNGYTGFTAVGAVGNADGAKVDTKGTVTAVVADLEAEALADEIVTLTLNDKNVVIGVDFHNALTGLSATNGGNKAVTAKGGAVNPTTNPIILFKGGLKVVEGLQIAASTPIYVYDDVATSPSVSVATYDKFEGSTKSDTAPDAQKVFVYTNDAKNVSAVVVRKSALTTDASSEDTVEGVIASVSYSTKGIMDGFSILVGTEYKTADTFAGEIKKSAGEFKVGNLVTAKFKKGTNTLNSVAAANDISTGLLTVTDSAQNIFSIDGAGAFQMSTVADLTIAKPDDTKGVVATTIADVIKESDGKLVSLSLVEGSSATPLAVDSIVVTGTAAKASAIAVVTAKADAYNTANAGIDTQVEYDAAVAAKAEAELACAKAKSAGATDAEITAAFVAGTNATTLAAHNTALKAVGETLITGAATITAITGVSAAAGGTAAATLTAVSGALPTSVTVTLANGTEKTLTVAASDWDVSAPMPTGATAAADYNFFLKDNTVVGTTTYTIEGGGAYATTKGPKVTANITLT